jgi:hypothetical protein
LASRSGCVILSKSILRLYFSLSRKAIHGN